MNVSTAGASAVVARLPEQREGPGPDRVPDNDGDDAVAVKAAPPAGMGRFVDKTA